MALQRDVKRKIQNLLILIFSGVFAAFLVGGGFLYYYNPSASYKVKNILLSAEIAKLLSYDDFNVKTGLKTRYVFNGISFVFFDEQAKAFDKKAVSLTEYEQFYQAIEQNKSLLTVDEKVADLFEARPFAELALTVKTEKQAEWQKETRIFQRLQIAQKGNYFRIYLSDPSFKDSWIYFYYPDIYKKALELFQGDSA